ncbi:hypothetical protein MRB53_040201 [Persea americana]|nr:hypothetical protein MRB53_040201 [Persea americana]
MQSNSLLAQLTSDSGLVLSRGSSAHHIIIIMLSHLLGQAFELGWTEPSRSLTLTRRRGLAQKPPNRSQTTPVADPCAGAASSQSGTLSTRRGYAPSLIEIQSAGCFVAKLGLSDEHAERGACWFLMDAGFSCCLPAELANGCLVMSVDNTIGHQFTLFPLFAHTS